MNAYVALDLVSAALVLLVVISFVRIYRMTRESSHIITALGFALLAIGMSAVSATVFDVAPPNRWQLVRLVAHTGAGLVIFATFTAAYRPALRRPLAFVSGALVTMALTTIAVDLVLPGGLQLGFPVRVLVGAHVLQFSCYVGAGLVLLAAHAHALTLERLLVPAAMIAYAGSKYTWIIIDITNATAIIPLVYAWRLVTIMLLLLALWWRPSASPPPDLAALAERSG